MTLNCIIKNIYNIYYLSPSEKGAAIAVPVTDNLPNPSGMWGLQMARPLDKAETKVQQMLYIACLKLNIYPQQIIEVSMYSCSMSHSLDIDRIGSTHNMIEWQVGDRSSAMSVMSMSCRCHGDDMNTDMDRKKSNGTLA